MAGKKVAVTEHFFKVMMPGFHQKLNLPPIVSKEVEKQKSRRATLESRVGKWKISLCRNNESGVICFNQGWSEFVKSHALQIGDFVFFQHTADLHFNVSVFDSSMCENEFHHQDQDPMPIAIEDESGYFEKVMVPWFGSSTRVSIPVNFVRLNNLWEQKSVVLRDGSGRAWKVKILEEKGRLRMCGGWRDFYESNSLKDGDTCVFHLNRRLLTPTTIFFDVQIFPI